MSFKRVNPMAHKLHLMKDFEKQTSHAELTTQTQHSRQAPLTTAHRGPQRTGLEWTDSLSWKRCGLLIHLRKVK